MTNNKKPLKEVLPPVSVIIPMRNASTTLLETLNTIVKQAYPIREIIVIDNVSKDNSREIVLSFIKKSKIPMRLLLQKKDKGVSSSYNWGTKVAKSDLVVFLTSDCSLPTTGELTKLTEPLRKDPTVVATYSTCVLPEFVWNTYNFWEKYHTARMVGNESSAMVLKFDCVRRKSFLNIGGFDEINFGGDGDIAGEDAELSTRLGKEGKIVPSKARSLHIHYRGDDYNLKHRIKSRKISARSYGRFLRKSAFLSPIGAFPFTVAPTLAILPFVPYFHTIGIALVVLYSFWYSEKMFTTKSTLTDPRILTIPLLNILFLYYELFWTVEAFFTVKKVK